MTKSKKTCNRYSICFKEKVIEEVSSGSSISEVRRRYGIKGGNTVQQWIKKLGREELLSTVIRIEMRGERDRIKALEKEVNYLKIKLGEKILALETLEELVKIVSKDYDIDIKRVKEKYKLK